MDKLENFIRQNRELFDDLEPSRDHLRKFEKRLDREETSHALLPVGKVWMRVAAAVLVLMTTGLIGLEFLNGRFTTQEGMALSSMNYSEEFTEAMDFYDQASEKKISEIDRLATECPQGKQLKAKAEKEISVFNDNQEELLTALKENPSNPRIQAALIQNQQMKETALSNLVLQGNLSHCKEK